MTLNRAHKLFEDERDEIVESFHLWRSAPTGGLTNPEVVGVVNGDLEIRCHYDGYGGEDDRWTWFYDPVKRRFYN